jgi:hypothetical protein
LRLLAGKPRTNHPRLKGGRHDLLKLPPQPPLTAHQVLNLLPIEVLTQGSRSRSAREALLEGANWSFQMSHWE